MKLIADCIPNKRLMARREPNSLRWILTVKKDENSHLDLFLNALCLYHQINFATGKDSLQMINCFQFIRPETKRRDEDYS